MKVTFNLNGGDTINISPNQFYVANGEKYVCDDCSFVITDGAGKHEIAQAWPTATKSGAEFAGWWTKETGGTKITEDTVVTETGPHTLYAHWKADDAVSVKLNTNVPSSSIFPVTNSIAESISVFHGAFYGVLPTPTRTGYTFKGWYLEKAGVIRIDGGSTVNTTEDHTLYAIWQYTLSFDTKCDSAVSPSSKLVTIGSTYGDLPTPTRSGYTFKGWSLYDTEKEENSMIMSANSNVVDIDDHTLYAIWEKNSSSSTSYKVSFNANGGSGAPASQNKTHGQDLTLSSTKPTRTGYTFKGWGTSSSDTTADYQPGGKYTADANEDLYAIWIIDSYKIEYTLNGGTVSPANKTSYNVETDTFTLNNPSNKTGYTFSGWTGSNGTTPSKTVTISKGSTGNKSYVARFTPIMYVITYDKNGGTGTMTNTLCNYDTASNLRENTFTKEGYTFVGWNTKKDGSGTTYKDKAEIKNLTATSNATITLYAQWKANGTADDEEKDAIKYSVKYNANGGKGTMKDSTHTYGVASNLRENTFTKEGYTFVGWNTKADGTGKEYSGGQTVSDLSKTNGEVVNLYAQWEVKSDDGNNSGTIGGVGGFKEDSDTSKDQTTNKGEAITNPKTGSLAVILVSVIGIGALVYLIYYYKKIKTNN